MWSCGQDILCHVLVYTHIHSTQFIVQWIFQSSVLSIIIILEYKHDFFICLSSSVDSSSSISFSTITKLLHLICHCSTVPYTYIILLVPHLPLHQKNFFLKNVKGKKHFMQFFDTQILTMLLKEQHSYNLSNIFLNFPFIVMIPGYQSYAIFSLETNL